MTSNTQAATNMAALFLCKIMYNILMSLSENGPEFKIRTVSKPKTSKELIGAGSFGEVQFADLSTQILRADHTGEYAVTRERTPQGQFVTKTFTRPSAEKDAARSVRFYDQLKSLGIKHIPGTHRISDSDPRIVISTYLGKNKFLVTSNTDLEESDRPKSINLTSLSNALSELEIELRTISANGIQFQDSDVIFFELSKKGGEGVDVSYYFADFDTLELAIDEDEAFLQSAKAVTKALFRLMMIQKLDADKSMQNWAEVASVIQLWAAGFGVDARGIYKEFMLELNERNKIAK